MIVTTLDPSLLGDIDMPYSNHPIPDRLMVGHGFKRLRARLTTIATPTAASSPCPARAYARRARRPAPTTRPPQPAHPTLQVVDVRYQAGSQFGSGFEQQSQRDASVREIPLAPQVVEVMRRRLPPGSNPAALLFTGLGGGPGQRSGPGVKKGTRTVLSRHNFHRTYHGALANSPTQPPRDSGRPPPASWALRGHGPLTGEQLAAQLSAQGRTAVKATIDCALAEFAAAEVAADARTGRWMLRQPPSIPCLRRSTCTAPTKPGTPS
jgi:hypothetical protein